jgi:preprotein translocase subunit SecG
MYIILGILHVAVCIFLILVVLLQTGRGSDIGAVFGGGASQTLFGSAGPGTFLGKVTVAVAVIFMITSLTMASRVFTRPPRSVMDKSVPATSQEAPATQPQEEPSVPLPADSEKAPEQGD